MKAIFFLLAATTCFADEARDPKAIVEEIFQKAGQELMVSDESLQAEVTRLVDFEAMAKAAAGKLVPAGEFGWFQNTLKEIVTRTVYPEAPGFLKGVNITYKAVEISGAKANVYSLVKRKAEVTDVSYQLSKTSQGDWKVIDVSIDGESWVGNIREQVKSTMAKKKWKGLKEALSKRLDKLRKKV